MTKKYTIILSDAEDKALSTIAVSPKEWIDNAVHDRCRIAIEQIVAEEVQRKLAAGETISGSKEDIVLSAPVETAAERESRIQAEIAAAEKQQG